MILEYWIISSSILTFPPLASNELEFWICILRSLFVKFSKIVVFGHNCDEISMIPPELSYIYPTVGELWLDNILFDKSLGSSFTPNVS